ncbi:MAG: hypothetical protein AAF434_05410 [Pseudomonadota bacterium]
MSNKVQTAVIFGTGPTALGAIWDAKYAGLDVILVTAKKNDVAALSRALSIATYVSKDSSEKQLETLLNLECPANHTILWPVNDDQVELVSRHYDTLSEKFFIPLTSWQFLEHTVDKFKLSELANQGGISAPWALEAADVISGKQVPPRFPCLIKPKQTPKFFAHYHKKLHQAENLGQAIELCEDAMRNDLEVMACEYIPGEATNDLKLMCLYRDGDGNTHCPLLVEKVRTYPLKFGLGAVIRSIPLDEDLLDASKKLLEVNQYRGFAMIEWKRDSETNTYTLIEINPRPVLFQNIFRYSGINYIKTIIEDAEGREIKHQQFITNRYWIQNFSDYRTFSQMRKLDGFRLWDFFWPYFKRPVYAYPFFLDSKPFLSLLKRRIGGMFKVRFDRHKSGTSGVASADS